MSRNTEKGFTIIEAVMAVVILGVMIIALPSAMDSITANAARSQVMTVAAYLAKEKMEEVMVRKALPAETGYNLIGNIVAGTVGVGPDAQGVLPGETGSCPPPFNAYGWRIDARLVDYNPALQVFQNVAVDQGYKSVEVRVYQPGIPVGPGAPGTVVLTTIVGDYGI